MLREPEVGYFTDIIKIAIMLNKIALRESLKVKRIRQNLLRCNFFCISQHNKIADFGVKKYWCLQNFWGVSRDLHTFLIFLGKL